MLIPPDAFGIVENGVYRSNAMQPSNFEFLGSLKLKTVVMLSAEAPTRAVQGFLDGKNIKVFNLGLQGNNWKQGVDWRPVSEEIVKEALQIILNRLHHPVMLMCTSGIHQSGIIIGCLRKLQRWNFNSIIEEYRSFAGSKSRYVNEQFIELFDLDLITLPKTLPSWFVEQEKMFKEEDVKQKLKPNEDPQLAILKIKHK